MIDPSIFRDYDIRAIVPTQLDEDGVRKIAKGIASYFRPKSVMVGRDTRLTSPAFHRVFVETLLAAGVDVCDLGLISTDMLYFAAGTYDEEMAITISASHNPPEYNGMKMVKKGSIPVSGETGLYALRDLVMSGADLAPENANRGSLTQRNILESWTKHVLSFVALPKLKPLKMAIDTGNGMAGVFLPALETKLPFMVERLYYELDGRFPNHIPSPIEAKNMVDVIAKVKEKGCDLGMAFDGDGDRVFLVDENGKTLTGTVMTAIIAENILKKNPHETILYNSVVGRIVPEIVRKYGAHGVRVRVGHTLIKEAMRKYDAVFCGEHSGHYYFRQNFYADSAIIAALQVVELMCFEGKKLSELASRYDIYIPSGEINFVVSDKEQVMKEAEGRFGKGALSVDWLDGLSVWFKKWWFNLRPSNTEPLLRLNLEADSATLLQERLAEVSTFIESLGGQKKE